MDATAEVVPDAGSNTQTQPSQLQLYLRQNHAASAAAAAHSQARLGHEVVDDAGDFLLVLKVTAQDVTKNNVGMA
jgi:hypothetical protein